MLELNGSLLRQMSCLCLWWFFASTLVVVIAEEKKVAERQLNQTPTWAVASVCTFFIVVSVLLEKLIHKVGTVWSWIELVLWGFNGNGLSLTREKEFNGNGLSLTREKELSLSWDFGFYVLSELVYLSCSWFRFYGTGTRKLF